MSPMAARKEIYTRFIWLANFIQMAWFIFRKAHITACIDDAPSDTLLTPGIVNTFKHQIAARSQLDKVSVLGAGKLAKTFHANAYVFACNGDDYLATPALQEEVFGPAALVVRYDSEQQLMTLVNQLQGQLTASVHGTDADLNKADSLIEALQYKVGRLIKNQMPHTPIDTDK